MFPDREEVLTQDESRKLSDDLLLIYVHFVGVFDAFGIALHRLMGADMQTAERASDILKPAFRKKIGFEELENFFSENDAWFRRIKEDMRNRYVHRVPPYVAPAMITKDEAEEIGRIEFQINDAMKKLDIDRVNALNEQKAKIGRFSPFISFVDEEKDMFLLPTVLDDIFRFQVIALTILEALVPRLAFVKRQQG